jgi:uncharacterized protein
MSDNLAVVRRLYRAFQDGDPGAAAAALAPDVEWVEHFPFPGVARGPAQVLAVFERVTAAFDRYDMRFEAFLQDGDVVVVVGRYAVRRRDLPDTFESAFAHIYRLRDGRVSRYEGLLDTAAARDLFGGAR